MKRRILLVAGDHRITDEVLPSLRSNPNWNPQVAPNATEALVLLGQGPCDAVVCDLRLAGGAGALLLDEIMKRQPQARRIALADLSDRATLIKCVGATHQFLGTPCEGELLVSALERAFSFDVWLPDEQVQRLLGRMNTLPSPPNLFFQIVKQVQSPDASLDDVGALIARDIAITAKLLRVVNSAAFGLSHKISNPAEAVMHLGIETTKSMVLLAHCFSYFDKVKKSDFSPEALWVHSLRVGQLARAIAREEDAAQEVVEQSFTAGMLHDLGKLALVANMPAEYSQSAALSREENISRVEAETKILGASHAEVGASLLATWGLAPDIVEALAMHHLPTRLLNRQFCPLTAVHVANAMDHAIKTESDPVFDEQYLASIGAAERVEAWKSACVEEIESMNANAMNV